jgi:peptidoglycan hydrolase-like protein with peptidoglycan-binding domain
MTSSQVAALQAQIASLQAQLAAASGTSMTAPSTTFTMDLTIGSTGSQVTALQTWLIAKGYSIPAGATGYFGTQTKAALAAYQAASGITPAAGYFGPITRAKVNASGTTTTTTTTTTTGGTTTTGTTTGSTTLSGGEGTVNNFQTIGSSNVTLGSGATQQVYGFQFQAGGSDLQVSRIYYDLANIGTNGTTRPWNVFNTATLTDASGNTVATLDASNQNNYSEDGTYSNGNQIYRLDFENLNTIVKENATQAYYLTLSTQSAYATGNVSTNTVFEVGLAPQGLRATDAMGIQEYSTANSSFSNVTLNNTTSGTVTLSAGSDNPQTTTLMANQNNSTSNVVLNTFTLQNQGTSNVELYTLPVNLYTASSSNGTNTLGQSSNLVQSLALYQGTTLLDTESPSSTFQSGGVLTFKNLNFTIPTGTTDEFRVVATIQPVGGSNPAPSGAAATVSVNASGAGTGIDIENPGGAIITPTGSAIGYPIAFAINGLTVASSPTTASATAVLSNGTGSQQTGTFTFVFNVTSFGQTIYVSATSSAYSLTVIDNSTGVAASSTQTISSALTTTATRSPMGNYQINSGQTATFTVTATLAGGAGHYYHAILNSLNYGTTDASPAVTSVLLPSNYTTTAVAISS